jgi:TonB family protein
VAIKQNMPRWNPPDAMARDASSGAIRVQIDATGRVTGATMARPIHPLFDVLMVDAAKGWRYRPATRDGEPIPWESVVTIRVEPTVR